MHLAGNSDSDIERMRTINMLIDRQTEIDERVERLESLEGRQWSDGRGCVQFMDYDFLTGAGVPTVEVDPEFAENGDHIAAHATMFWKGACNDTNDMVELWMRINQDVSAEYYYSYKYSNGGALTQIGLDAQTKFVVGRIPGYSRISAFGHITVPIYATESRHMAFGDWTAYDSAAALNAKQEKGEWGGLKNEVLKAIEFNFYINAGVFVSFQVYLYVWCPQLTVGPGLPDD
jgi:hypothetical protein